ncbi:hypothetical protein Bcav_0687 [Beutenbergia cavernae DSM 12333]|uniref:RAMA domain-containing protein n=1 Tax=Beutenbergia cavernae (strain ATCC BAA-8 / DSM 12333 / CCUG 43141 / JCM 11478 / NBRC 16432 / NCIMB 13614 / HKI 0122) TaxID=471853 RepID=C5BYJ0_BEUC1|nr:hypothetical protein [Beutenbergia cavernae]ACQ78948.1 hypothetical protein Bcav_0687 [Beutenbergia cavernae DSM 12333]
MPLFEFEHGRPVQVRLGRSTRAPLDEQALALVRESVLEMLLLPVFPVAWCDDDPDLGPYLLTLDGGGSVVVVAVVPQLDETRLVAALAQASRSGRRGWRDVAEAYPPGVPSLRRDWNVFRETLPPSPAAVPRLVVVTGDAVGPARDAVTLLGDAGVVVHELTARELVPGRVALELTAVEPVPVAPREVRLELGPAAAVRALGTGEPASPVTRRERRRRETEGESPAAPVVTSPVRTPPLGIARPAPNADLAAVAALVGAGTELVAATNGDVSDAAVLTAEGLLVLADGRVFSSVDEAAAEALGRTVDDGWLAWRFGRGGPFLGEALLEARFRSATGRAGSFRTDAAPVRRGGRRAAS